MNNINTNVADNVKSFIKSDPFSINNLIGVLPASQVFSMDEIGIKILSDKFNYYKANKSWELVVKAILIKLSIVKAVGDSVFEECLLILELAEAYF
jgi:hypothetical protein